MTWKSGAAFLPVTQMTKRAEQECRGSPTQLQHCMCVCIKHVLAKVENSSRVQRCGPLPPSWELPEPGHLGAWQFAFWIFPFLVVQLWQERGMCSGTPRYGFSWEIMSLQVWEIQWWRFRSSGGKSPTMVTKQCVWGCWTMPDSHSEAML